MTTDTALPLVTTKLEPIECTCGVWFAAPARLIAARRANGDTFYCPNGHRLTFTETEVDRLRVELERAQDATARAEGAARTAREERDREALRHRATKGLLTQTRKRVANGVCPCCHRMFVNVQRHMATKHPDFAESEALGGTATP